MEWPGCGIMEKEMRKYFPNFEIDEKEGSIILVLDLRFLKLVLTYFKNHYIQIEVEGWWYFRSKKIKNLVDSLNEVLKAVPISDKREKRKRIVLWTNSSCMPKHREDD